MKKMTIRQPEHGGCLVYDLGKQIRATVINRGSRLEECEDTKPEAGSPAPPCLFPHTGMRMESADSISQMWVTMPIVLTYLNCPHLSCLLFFITSIPYTARRASPLYISLVSGAQ
jgi:hypothetical protein